MPAMRYQSSSTSLSWIPVAATPCRVASVEAAELDRGALQELSKDHRRTRPDRS